MPHSDRPSNASTFRPAAWIAFYLRGIANTIDPPPAPSDYWRTAEQRQAFEVELARWQADRGDRTLRLNYPLSAESVVLDVGGYEGQWASDIFAKYLCPIHVFEPVSEFAQDIRRRFKKNEKIRVHEYGLASSSRSERISLEADGSSIIKLGTVSTTISVRDIREVLSDLGFTHVDLMKVNIEGAEYELLEYLTGTGLALRFRNIQVQFHDFIDDPERRLDAVQKALSKTHRSTYQYKFIWENWELK